MRGLLTLLLVLPLLLGQPCSTEVLAGASEGHADHHGASHGRHGATDRQQGDPHGQERLHWSACDIPALATAAPDHRAGDAGHGAQGPGLHSSESLDTELGVTVITGARRRPPPDSVPLFVRHASLLI